MEMSAEATPEETERRSGEDRRDDAGAVGGRRADDRRVPGPLSTAWAIFWALIGASVVLYLFFAALGTVDPSEAKTATIIVAALAVLWLAHSWRRLWAGGFTPQGDRERRGF